MINLYLLEIQEPELAQELREGIFSKVDNYRKCLSIKEHISHLEDVIRNLTRELKNGLSSSYKKELDEHKKELVRVKLKYKQLCEKPKQVSEAGFESKPKGWTDKSIQKAGKTLAKHVGKKSPSDKGFFDKCVAKIGNKMKNPEGYCASLKDEAHKSTGWRGKGKTPAEVKVDVKKEKFKV
jgi:hypothetical protein